MWGEEGGGRNREKNGRVTGKKHWKEGTEGERKVAKEGEMRNDGGRK